MFDFFRKKTKEEQELEDFQNEMKENSLRKQQLRDEYIEKEKKTVGDNRYRNIRSKINRKPASKI